MNKRTDVNVVTSKFRAKEFGLCYGRGFVSGLVVRKEQFGI